MNPIPNLNVVPFVSVDNMMKLVMRIGIERFMTELVGYLEEDFRRWEMFDKTHGLGRTPPRASSN
jgi:ornithine cyclodeaminase